MTPPLDDDEIINGLRSGNELRVNEITACLLVQWRGIVVWQVKGCHGDPDSDVQPVLDEALADFVRNVREGIYERERSAPATYFTMLVRHCLLNRLRRNHNWRKRHGGNLDGQPEPATSKVDDANHIMESEENRKKMMEAILKLDKPCQQVLFDYWWEGKSLKEIAETLGKSWDATKQKHHRCLDRLRKLLGDDPTKWFDD